MEGARRGRQISDKQPSNLALFLRSHFVVTLGVNTTIHIQQLNTCSIWPASCAASVAQLVEYSSKEQTVVGLNPT